MKKKTLIMISVGALIITIILVLLINSKFLKKQKIEDIYLDIFNGRRFSLNGKNKKIDDLLYEDKSIDFYSFVDYENDGHLELFVKLTGVDANGFIFNYKGNKMYGYEVKEDVRYNTSDGYSFYNGDNEGWVKYSFKGKKLLKTDILKISENNKCTYEKKDVDCSDIVTKEIELLNSIGDRVEEIIYKAKDSE